jgi:hypothetical protein
MLKMRFVLLFFLLITVAFTVSAQPGAGDPGTKPGTVPISGIEWLLLGGATLGARKLYKFRKNR